ncbi:MAG: hypothetical protein EOO14_24680, partial [Chitinophagaceae bacterium]
PKTVATWQKWLAKNHLTQQAVWVVFHTRKSGKSSLTWSESVDVALCFGWIDSKKIRIDEDTSHQFFSRRKPKSTWSKINKEKVARLLEEGRMAKAGLAAMEIAKQNGSWTLLDSVDSLFIPPDLQAALEARKGATEFFAKQSNSVKKAMLQWLVLARRPETRHQRIHEMATLAAAGKKPKQF